MVIVMLSFLSKLLPGVFSVIDKAIPDGDLREKIKRDIQLQMIQMDQAELKAATSVLVAELTGESWLQRNWRPLVMITFAGLVVAHWLGYTAPNLSEPQVLALLGIVKVGLGGYVLGRSAEKAVKAYKGS